MISADSLTVLAMVAVLALGTRRVQRRSARIAMAGLTGLFAALWLAEFGSALAGAILAVVALVVLGIGVVGLAAGRVPLIGIVRARSPRVCRKSSGVAETIDQPSPWRACAQAAPSGRSAPTRARGEPRKGARRCWTRFTW